VCKIALTPVPSSGASQGDFAHATELLRQEAAMAERVKTGAMGQLLLLRPLSDAQKIGVTFNPELPAERAEVP
jgi:hypothetical protein